MLAWDQIDTVLLDMDGTLLDLHFDNHFWLEVVPHKLAQMHNISVEQARTQMDAAYAEVHGTLEWYCLDYWANKLNMDIMAAKREIQHLISMREDTLPFLDALRDSGRRVLLLTNAHPDSLSLKVERTQLDQHIDTLISTHTYGVSKESQALWQAVQQEFEFDPARTLFVDDSLSILQAAKDFGIGQVLAVSNPDSQQPIREISDYPAIQDYRYLLTDIRNTPVSAS